MYNIEQIRADFPLLTRVQGKYPYAYLDTGATAQKPQVVIDKMRDLMSKYNSNIHRGVHELSGYCTTQYEQARETVRRYIDAASTREIIFTSGATSSINLVSYSYGSKFIGKGDIIVVSEMEHHANIVPWQLLAERVGAELRVFPFNEEGELCMEQLDSIITEGVKLVAVAEVSNVLGTHNPIRVLSDKAHSVGAVIVVDGCQGAVHNTVSVRDMGCDFYAFSAHKLYGPTGVGVLYGKEELLELMPPFMGGGDMVKHVTFAGTSYADLPLKFEAGTTPYLEAICMAEAIRYVEGVGLSAIREHEHSMLRLATEGLSTIDGLRIYGASAIKSPIVSFNIKGVHPYDMGQIMDKMGVAVRTGTHCAEPVMTHYGVTGMVRASIGMYTNEDDVNNLIKATTKAAMMLK